MRTTNGCFAAVIVAASASACKSPPSYDCLATDMGCIQSHLRIYQPANGPEIPLTTIRAGMIKPSQINAGKGVPTVTAAAGTPSSALSLDFGSSIGGCAFVELSFTDPNGARIGGCFNLRPKSQVPGSFGSSDMVAFESVHDGLTSGSLSFVLCSILELQGTADFAIDLYPVSPPTPGQGALAQALNGGPIAVGTPLSFAAHIGAGGGTAGGSSGTSGSTSGSGSGSSCPSGDLLVSTLVCTPNGSTGTGSYCLSSGEYTPLTGQPLPAACAPQGSVGCLVNSGVSGEILAHPCCPSLTCRVSSTCGDSTGVYGGTCLP